MVTKGQWRATAPEVRRHAGFRLNALVSLVPNAKWSDLAREFLKVKDDVAGLQGGHELLLDIGAEALAVDRPIEDARCNKPVAAQRAEEGQSAPVTVRSKCAQPFALWSPATQRRHVGLDPGLIDEDEPGGIEAILPGAPSRPPARDVCARLLKGEQCFF